MRKNNCDIFTIVEKRKGETSVFIKSLSQNTQSMREF